MSILRSSLSRQMLRTLKQNRLVVSPTTRHFAEFQNKEDRPTFSPKNWDTNKEGEVTFEFKLEPIPRPNEALEAKRARLLYQSRKRGILESDLILSRFANLYLKEMTYDELVEYDKLLDENDWDIYYWVTKNEDVKPCPEHWKQSKLMLKIQDMVQNHKRELIRMPDLY